ncbi:MAG: hypothetical protein K5864_07420 [Bacteroidales bacterium]|nr:hypothetical protein [Bacteroidales bacterium]
MKSFSIFPHKGYLNTDFQIQVFDEKIRSFYIDQATTPLKNVHSFRMSAGKHLIRSIIEGSDRYDIEIDEVEVEDAVRLGGSELEAGYCFDNSPWIAVVRKDRTYFFNTDTGDNHVENGLSPVKILAINKRLLSLNYGIKEDNGKIQTMEFCVYDVCCGEVIGRFEKYVFHNLDIAVFSDTSKDGTLCLSVIWHQDDCKIQTIQCKSYTIIDEILYYCCIDDESYKVIKLQSDGTGAELPYCSGAKDDFIGFILNHYYLHRSGRYFFLKDIIEPTNYIGVPIHSYGGVIRKINEIKVTQSDLVEDFYSLVTNNKGICSKLDLHVDILDLTLIENSDGIYTKVVHNNYVWSDYNYKRPNTWSELSMNCSDEFNKIGERDSIYISDKILIVKGNESIKIFHGGKCVRELSGGTLYKTPLGSFIYAKREEEIVEVYKVNVSKDELIIQGNEKDIQLSFVERYGILTENSKNYRIYYIDDNIWQHMAHQKYIIEEKNHQCFLRDTDDDGQCYLLSEHQHPVDLPVSINSILSVSNNGSIILSQSPRGLIIHEKYSEKTGYDIKSDLLDIIDTSKYRNALFADDGNHTIYCKEGVWFYYDIVSEKEIEFEMESNIALSQRRGFYNMNFYIYYKETERRVDIVNPISLQKIPPAFLSDYVFVSPSGKLFSRTSVSSTKRYFYFKEKKHDEGVLLEEFLNQEEMKTIQSFDWTNSLDRTDKQKACEVLYVTKILLDLFNQTKTDTQTKPYSIIKLIKNYEICEKRHSRINVYNTDDSVCISEIELPDNLYYLNNVSFSHDDRFVSISGKCGVHSWTTGFIGVYDLMLRDWVYGPDTPNYAIWKSFFSTSGLFAYYNSIPNARCGELENGQLEEIPGKSILTFSRSGKYIAMSNKGYIPFSVNPSSWGHMRSANIYVRKVGNNKELRFSDHGDEIRGLRSKDVTCVSFSPDDRKLMSVSQDGVIIIRNLHLEELQEIDETLSQRDEFRVVLEEADGWADPEKIICMTEKYFHEGNGVFYTKDGKKLVAFENNFATEYCVKDGCEIICNNAFDPCVSFADAQDALETGVEDNINNNLSIVSLPKTIRQIGKTAFSCCKKLKEIRVPKGYLEKFKQMIDSDLWDKLVEV